jgi:hypothetical protein
MAFVGDVHEPMYVNGTAELDSEPCTGDARKKAGSTTMSKVPRRFDRPLEILDLTEDGSEDWESWEFVYERQDVL